MIGDTGPGDYRVGLGATPPDLTISLAETITTAESHGGFTADPDHLAIYVTEDIRVRDQHSIPMSIFLYETISLAEVARVGRNLGLRRSESITVRELARPFVPVKILLTVFETIRVTDPRPTMRSPVLVIRAHESITVIEGLTNGGANGNTLVVGPAPPPLVVPDDYWTVGI